MVKRGIEAAQKKFLCVTSDSAVARRRSCARLAFTEAMMGAEIHDSTNMDVEVRDRYAQRPDVGWIRGERPVLRRSADRGNACDGV